MSAHVLLNLLNKLGGVRWLSGRVLDLRSRGCGCEPNWRHCTLCALARGFILCLVLVQPRKTHLEM